MHQLPGCRQQVSEAFHWHFLFCEKRCNPQGISLNSIQETSLLLKLSWAKCSKYPWCYPSMSCCCPTDIWRWQNWFAYFTERGETSIQVSIAIHMSSKQMKPRFPLRCTSQHLWEELLLSHTPKATIFVLLATEVGVGGGGWVRTWNQQRKKIIKTWQLTLNRITLWFISPHQGQKWTSYIMWQSQQHKKTAQHRKYNIIISFCLLGCGHIIKSKKFCTQQNLANIANIWHAYIVKS